MKDGHYAKNYYNKYYQKNKMRLRKEAIIKAHNRRGRGGFLTKEIIQMVYEDNIKQFGTLTCYLCLKSIEFGQDSLEHKTPLIRGGTNEYSNLAIAHRKCNLRKNRRTVKEYLYKEQEVEDEFSA